MTEFVIKIEDIADGGKAFAFPVTSAWIDSAMEDSGLRGDPTTEAGALEVTVHKTGQSGAEDLAISGRLNARVVAECARCLGDVPIDASVRVRLVLSPLAQRHDLPEEVELTPEDLERDYYDGVSFSLDTFVRESLILEVPMKPLCDEACAGIEVPAHVSGSNDPDLQSSSGMDARFAPLLKLKRELGAAGTDGAPPTESNQE